MKYFPRLNLWQLVGGVVKTIGAKAVEFTGTLTGTSATFTGSVSGGLPRVEKAATGSLSAAECRGTLVSNKGQTGDAVINLPTLAEGLALVVHLETTVANYYRLDPEVAAVIRFDGDTLTAGYYVGIASAIAGAEIIFKAVYNNAGTLIWDARTVDGYWLAQT